MPSLTAAEDPASVLALIVGFVLGVSVMIGMATFIGDGDVHSPPSPAGGELLGVQMQESEPREWLVAERPLDKKEAMVQEEDAGTRRLLDAGKGSPAPGGSWGALKRPASMSHFAYVRAPLPGVFI